MKNINLLLTFLILSVCSFGQGATLPFLFDGRKSNLETFSTRIFAQVGLGSDYGTSPHLKFDDTDDLLILKLASTPDSISFKLKQNGSTSSYVFNIQESADSVTFTNVLTLSSGSGSGNGQTETYKYKLNPSTRYINWVYSLKPSATNFALGNISVVAPLICNTAPTTQVTIATANTTSNATDIHLTAGNGVGRVVKINTSNTFNTPADGTDPIADLVYTSGEQVFIMGLVQEILVLLQICNQVLFII